MAEVNENLARDNAKCMFVTLFIGVLDLDTGELLYANGGHNPPLRLGDDGVAWLKGISGPVVGAMEGMNYGPARRNPLPLHRRGERGHERGRRRLFQRSDVPCPRLLTITGTGQCAPAYA